MHLLKLLKKFRHQVFWPPLILLLAALIYSVVDAQAFLSKTQNINSFILDHFGWLFSIGTSLMLLTCVVLIFHPIGKKKIGGPQAQPILSQWRWFSIVLCTTIATGILFWGTAEPLYHLSDPPAFMGAAPFSEQAADHAMGFMYLHWSFTPYAIYVLPALMFALAFYNRKKSFSLQSTLFPLQKNQKENSRFGILVDGICLYALVAGMAASLGAGILTLTGGVRNLLGIEVAWLSAAITILIVLSFTISAVTGLMKGIRILSDINARIFVLLALVLFLLGPFQDIVQRAASGLLNYIQILPEMSLVSVIHPSDTWPKEWTTFYWANWMAWAPITALFLGRIGYGYTVRKFLLFNWLLPSFFGIAWMSVFSGTAISLEMNNLKSLSESLNINGPESIIFELFEFIPFSTLLAAVFLVTAFLSYVTAADSNTEAMSGISSTGISPEAPAPPVFIKLIWGIAIGVVAFVMINMAGIDGIKMLSNLGGLPALFLLVAINIGLLYLLVSKKYRNL